MDHCALCGWIIWFWQRRASARAFAETHPVHRRCLDAEPDHDEWAGNPRGAGH
jgi:hypothetical protein